MRLPRQIKNSLLPLLLVFAAQKVCAQLTPAEDFFNGGAQFYISNNIPAAKERVETGLKIYPDNDKLKKLEELLKQQQQSQSSQSQQNQQQSSQQNSQDQKKSDEQKQNQADQQKQAEQQKSNGEKNQNGENQAAAGQMTPEEAKRLLDAQKGDEQVLQLKPQGKPENQNKPVKDW